MAPVPRADLDGDNPSSDVGDSQDSPLRRQFSEPFRPQSTSTQMSQSPEPIHQVKCDWCGKLLMLPNDQSISEEDVLNDHINEAHPKTISFGYDGTEDGADETYDETGDLQDDDVVEEEGEDAEDDEEEEAAADAGTDADAEADTGSARPEGVPQDSEEITIVTTDDANGTQPTTTTVSVKNTPTDKLDPLEWLSNPRSSYPEGYRARTATWKREDVRERLHRFWTVHDTASFSPEYEVDTAKHESLWDSVFHDPSKSKKRDASEPLPHVLPYKKPKVERDQFLELQHKEIDSLVNMLRAPEKYSPEELYAITETAAFAMKTIQDEWFALDVLYLKANRHKRDEASYEAKKHYLQGHKKKGGPPLAHVNEDKLDFEEKKEAMLYGYKHTYFPNNTPLAPIRNPQDAFVQGGFVPTPAQARKMIAKQKDYGDRNMDSWATMKRHGLEYHPQMYEPRREPLAPKITRKRKAAEVELPSKDLDTEDDQNNSDPGDESEEDDHPSKRRTRPRGGKRAAAESYHSDGAPRRGAGRGRGRGRGRGNGRLASSRATFEVTPAPATQTSGRGRGRRGASTLGSSATPSAETTFPVTEPTTTESPTGQAPSLPKKETLSAEAIEEARRQKIANSKNPKRTKAMLDHWDRFNREGRIRNPKRSKAQIEQDRTVDGPDDSMPNPMGHGDPRSHNRSPSLAPLAGNLAPKGPGLPSMASVQAQQHMPPTFPPIGVAHYDPRPMNPYGPPPPGPPMAQLGQPMPPQYAPFPYVQYGMGHLPGSRDPRDPRH